MKEQKDYQNKNKFFPSESLLAAESHKSYLHQSQASYSVHILSELARKFVYFHFLSVY